MNKGLAVLTLKYIDIENIALYDELFEGSYDALKGVGSVYTILPISDGIVECLISNILYHDLVAYNDQGPLDHYDELCMKYGSDKVNLIITDNDELVKESILNIIRITKDSHFKSESLEVNFERHDISSGGSSIPDLIYEVIQENFDIVSQVVTPNIYRCMIKNQERKKET